METPTASQPPATGPQPGPTTPEAPQAEAPRTDSMRPEASAGSTYPPVRSGPALATPRPTHPPYPTAPAPSGADRKTSGQIIASVVAVFALIAIVTAFGVAYVVGAFLGGAGAMRTSVTSRTLAVSGAPSIVVSDPAGNVHITAGNASTVTVQMTKRVRAADNATAQRGFDSIGVNITQVGATITITSTFASWLQNFASSRSLDYTITLPAGSAVRANVSAGNIDVTNTTGVLALTTSAGNITTSGVTFGSGSVLKSSAGNITANGRLASAGSLQAQVSAGNVTLELPANTAMRLDADVSVGNLTITGFSVPITAKGFTGHRAVGETGSEPRGSVTIAISTGNITIAAR